MMSMIDEFFGYNQIEFHEDDQYKIYFTTSWGMFVYRRMPFGLINARATFQREMDLTFDGLINENIIVYLDDLTVYFKEWQDNLFHLWQVLERCRQCGVSLNTKNSVFGLLEGKLIGHIMLKEGIKIDPERVLAIQNLSLPSSKTIV